MIWFWILTIICVFVMFVVFLKNIAEAFMYTMAVIMFTLMIATMMDKMPNRSPDTFLSCPLEEEPNNE